MSTTERVTPDRDLDTFDVVVVGARCAGAPLATWLSRAGLRVAVVDRSTFPSDVLSTTVMFPTGWRCSTGSAPWTGCVSGTGWRSRSTRGACSATTLKGTFTPVGGIQTGAWPYGA